MKWETLLFGTLVATGLLVSACDPAPEPIVLSNDSGFNLELQVLGPDRLPNLIRRDADDAWFTSLRMDLGERITLVIAGALSPEYVFVGKAEDAQFLFEPSLSSGYLKEQDWKLVIDEASIR